MSVRIDREKSGDVPQRTRHSRAVLRGSRAALRGSRAALRGPRPEAAPARAAGACALVGVLDVAAGVVPRFRHGGAHTLTEVSPGALGPFAAALSLGAGVLLLLLAHGLRRRRRRAWRAAVALLPAGALAQFAHRHSLAGVLVPLALLAVLLRHRDGFTAPPDPRSRWRAVANFVLMGAGSLVLGLVVVSVHPDRMVGDPSFADRIEHVLYGLSGLRGPLDYTGATSSTVALSLGALGLLTAVTTVHLALRPERPATRLTEDDEARLRALLDEHGGRDPLGRCALGHFPLGHFLLGRCALRRDRAIVFSPSGRAAVTYRVVSGVMLADGDPIGDAEAWPGAIERFMDEAVAHSWTPAVTGCSGTGVEVWTRETGLDALGPDCGTVGEAADLSLAGRAMRTVRRKVRRIGRTGHGTRVRRVRDLGEGAPDRIRGAAGDRRGTDTGRGSSTARGRVGGPADGDRPVATTHVTKHATVRAADPDTNGLLFVAALRPGGFMGPALPRVLRRPAPARAPRPTSTGPPGTPPPWA